MAIAFCNAINRYTDHSCRLITTQERYGIDFEKDIHIPDIEDDDFGEVEQLLKDADIFHFHVLRDENSHLGPFVIRDYIKGKKILHHHHGHPDYLINVDAYNEKYRRLKRKVIVSTPDLLQIAKNATWVPNLVPLNDVSYMPRYEYTLPETSVKICQAPTRKYDKHTANFNKVMQEIILVEPMVRQIMIERTPHIECLKQKRACHIIFDHMRGWFGISSLESLSQGKPVIAGLDDWNIQCIKKFTGKDCLPWIVARDDESLKTVMTELVKDRHVRQARGEESRHFMENYWTEQQTLNVLLEVYQNL